MVVISRKWRPEIDLPGLCDAGDERGFALVANPHHFRQRLNQHDGHLGTAGISRGEIKLADIIFQDRGAFQFVKADSFVFREQCPALFPYERQPLGVFGTGREVAAMALVLHAMENERVEDGFAVVKIFVEIQNEVFRRRRPCSAPT